jgi:hypothetical protein
LRHAGYSHAAIIGGKDRIRARASMVRDLPRADVDRDRCRSYAHIDDQGPGSQILEAFGEILEFAALGVGGADQIDLLVQRISPFADGRTRSGRDLRCEASSPPTNLP